MNKIILNTKGRNHIKIYPLKEIIKFPEDNGEKIKKCQEIFVNLQQADNIIKHSYYRNVKKGYQISVWELDNKIYLINCIRDLDHNYITTIYISDNLNDMLGISKMLRENIDTIMHDYKSQIIDGKEAFEDYLKDCENKA